MNIPLIIINGTLGSGKTTLVKRLLSSPEFAGSFLIENEYASVNIDREAIADEHDDEMYEISGSCICCSTGEELEAAFEAVIAKDWQKPVILEATGMANSAVLLRRLFLNPRFAEHFQIRRMVLLIDSAETTELSLGLELEVKLSDIIILNKADINPDNAKALAKAVRSLNPRAQVVSAVKADIEIGLLAKGESRAESTFADVYADIDDIELSSASYAVVELTKALTPEGVRKALQPQTFGDKVNFQRAKGFFVDVEGNHWQVEATAKHVEVNRLKTPKPQVIVAIGDGITKENLREALAWTE